MTPWPSAVLRSSSSNVYVYIADTYGRWSYTFPSWSANTGIAHKVASNARPKALTLLIAVFLRVTTGSLSSADPTRNSYHHVPAHAPVHPCIIGKTADYCRVAYCPSPRAQ